MFRFIVLALFAIGSLTQAAGLYRWVTPEGTVVFSDRPPPTGQTAQTINFADLPSTPLPESARRPDPGKSAQSRTFTPDPNGPPVLFRADWCEYCRQAEAYLAAHRVPVRKFDIDTSAGMRAYNEAGGAKGIPLLFANGQRVQGFSNGAYDALFVKVK